LAVKREMQDTSSFERRDEKKFLFWGLPQSKAQREKKDDMGKGKENNCVITKNPI